jgi:hypothetical protein
VDRYRGKWETGGNDLDAEAAPEEEEAAVDSDLNDQTFSPKARPANCARPIHSREQKKRGARQCDDGYIPDKYKSLVIASRKVERARPSPDSKAGSGSSRPAN